MSYWKAPASFLIAGFIAFSLHPLPCSAQQSRIDADKLQRLIHCCDSTKADEILLIHRGKAVAHWKNEACDSVYMGTASMLKSWTGLVVGSLINRGLIGSVDDPVCRYLPGWQEGCKKQVTIRHLLTMSGGLNRRGARGVLSKSDMNAYVLGLAPDTLPGLRFSYSNESAQLLGMVIEKVMQKDAGQCFRELLFEPLGMDSTTLSRDSAGNFITYGGCKTTLEDASRVGLMMLGKGLYQGRRVVSEKWVEASVTPSPRAAYYGYLWWLDNNNPDYRNYAATGDLGQMTIVFPDLDLVFVRRQNCDLSPESVQMRWMGPWFLKLIADVVIK